MGNTLSLYYRPSPRKIFNSSSGKSVNFEFAANQITGWRNSQEDRYVCLPNFKDEFSFFAVYDGHGGEEVVVYLQRFLHKFVLKELEETQDIELALYLSFLNCDNSLRCISDAERSLIENDLEKEFEVPDKADRRKVLFDLNKGAGSSGESQIKADELKAEIVRTCLKELPSISYLTEAPVQDSDESDMDYQPGDTDINFLKENSSSDESSDEASLSGDSLDSTNDDITERNEDAGSSISAALNEPPEKKEDEDVIEDASEDLQIKGINSGSTATVLLMNLSTIYIAHVGDSKCVACIKGQAVDLSTDHRPTDEEEKIRISNAGGKISADGRIEGDIDMSRAFGDFRYKAKAEPFGILSVAPSISYIDISEDLEFIIVASDGIWNTMESADVINYMKRRIEEPSLELKDLCGELFEELIPSQVTDDGSGCDNMTAIVIKFATCPQLSQTTSLSIREVYEYSYINSDKSNKSSMKDDLVENVEGKEISQTKLEKINDTESNEQEECFALESTDENGVSEEWASSPELTEIRRNTDERIPTHQEESNRREKSPTPERNEIPNHPALHTIAMSKMVNNLGIVEEALQAQREHMNKFSSRRESPERKISNHPAQHATATSKMVYDLSIVDKTLTCVNNNINDIKIMLNQEIGRFNLIQQLHEHQRNFDINQYQTDSETLQFQYQNNLEKIKNEYQHKVERLEYQLNFERYQHQQTLKRYTQETVEFIDLTNDAQEKQCSKQNEAVPQVERAAIQSPPKQIETNLVDLAEMDEDIDNVQTPTMQVETKSTDLPSKEIQIPKQSASKEIESVEKSDNSKVVESALVQSSVQIVTNVDDLPNEAMQTTKEFVNKNEDETVRESCKTNSPVKKRDEFTR